MPQYHEDPRAGSTKIGLYASIAVELDWALAAAERADYRRDNVFLAALYDNAPELGERVRSMWTEVPTSCGGFMELEALAFHGGVLLNGDPDALLDRLEHLCATAPTELVMDFESAEDLAAVLERLRLLRTSAEVRDRYVALIRDVWAAVADIWEIEGRRAVDAAIAVRRELVGRGATWLELARTECASGELTRGLVSQLAPDDEVAIVPAFFHHKGLVLDFPGVVLLGVGTDASGAQARARTALLARRLKAISDPTRLAILDSLRTGPRTVTEIATAFSLAQPTVSNHVRLLRDAGLIGPGSDGQRRQLVVQHDVVVDLLDHLHSVLEGTARGEQVGALTP